MTSSTSGLHWLALRSTENDGYEVARDGTGTRYTVDYVEADSNGGENSPLRALRVDLPGYDDQLALLYSPGRNAFAKETAKKAAKQIGWTAFALINMYIAKENARRGYVRGVQVYEPGLGGPADAKQMVTRKALTAGVAVAGAAALSKQGRERYRTAYQQVRRIFNQPVEGYYTPDGNQPVVRGPILPDDLVDFLSTFGE